MKILYFLVLFHFLFQGLQAQVNESVIHLRSGKTNFFIKEKKTHTLKIDYSLIGDSLNSVSRSITGIFYGVSPNEIILNPMSKSAINYRGELIDSILTMSYPPGASPVGILKNSISLIKFESKSNHINVNGGTAFTFIGIFTTTILAPLISTNFNTGEIDSERYYRCVLAGVGFCMVSIPLYIGSKNKEFLIKTKDEDKKRTWIIVD